MPFLIDGYNLLFAAGMAQPLRPNDQRRDGELHAARWQLIRFLCRSLSKSERNETVIVFDAHQAPPGLSPEFHHQGIHVIFARDHEQADDLLEAMIQATHSPGKLTVISSDNRIKLAATRRRASIVDSDTWMMHLEHELPRRDSNATTASRSTNKDGEDTDATRGSGKISPSEVSHWLREFDLPDREAHDPNETAPTDRKSHRSAPNCPPRTPRPRKSNRAPKTDRPPRTSSQDPAEDSTWHPFPPGYGEDEFDPDDACDFD